MTTYSRENGFNFKCGDTIYFFKGGRPCKDVIVSRERVDNFRDTFKPEAKYQPFGAARVQSSTEENHRVEECDAYASKEDLADFIPRSL
jgi:hypothetical protein